MPRGYPLVGFAAREATDPMTRVWRHVEIAGPDDCWHWKPQSRQPNGYGKLTDCRGEKPKQRTVTRMIVADRDGLDYDDWSWNALHRCDNPPCCNPSHLYAGDHDQNKLDMVSRGRSTAGTRHPMAKLDEESVAQIRKLRAEGVPRKDVAAQFGVHPEHVTRITSRRIWS